MRKSILFILVTAGSLLGADVPKAPAPKTDLDLLQGAWLVASATVNGKLDDTWKEVPLTIKGTTITRKSLDLPAVGTIKLDPTKNPKTIDITFTEGLDKGKVARGLYRIDGDSWTLCRSEAGKERPKDFSAKAGSDNYLFVIKKKPPYFTDANLEVAVRAVLQHSTGDLDEDLLNNVYVLEVPGKGLKNLVGLEKCRNLALLRVTNNAITDLSPLSDCTNLQSLDVASNKISDVSPLKNLKKLQYLELSNNQVQKIEPLGGLSSLSALYLTGNGLSNIGPIGSLTKLSSLYLGHNQIRDLGPLAKVDRIGTLELNDNQIVDLAPLKKQTELGMLLLERNKIADLTPLVEMAKADAEGPKRFAPFLRLYLGGNPLSDAARSKQIPALKGYGLRIEG